MFLYSVLPFASPGPLVRDEGDRATNMPLAPPPSLALPDASRPLSNTVSPVAMLGLGFAEVPLGTLACPLQQLRHYAPLTSSAHCVLVSKPDASF